MDRTGFATGYDPALSVRDMADLAHRAEARGYDMMFFSEALLCNRDSVTAMTAFGLATSTIQLGCTQVVRLRTPVVMAQTLATLDELTGGRMVLAPGACTEKHARRHGLAPFAPAVSLREWVETTRRLLSGEKVTYKGQSLDMEGGGLNWRPRRTHVPFWIAAISKTGLRTAAQIADGVLRDAHTSPEYVSNAVAILKDAVGGAGRDWGSFEVAQIVPVSVEDTHAAAVDAVRWEAASRFESPNFAAETERRLRVGEPAVDRADFPIIAAAQARGGKAEVAKALPARIIEETTATGTPDEVLARVARYRHAGVTFPLLRPQQPHQIPRVLELFAKKR
jgi:alkanesulfonate monooxygenase SsuD/methylene tetrahydromethanopterin reductase-like flavin-dependent oxidoreductase (luciferase family)